MRCPMTPPCRSIVKPCTLMRVPTVSLRLSVLIAIRDTPTLLPTTTSPAPSPCRRYHRNYQLCKESAVHHMKKHLTISVCRLAIAVVSALAVCALTTAAGYRQGLGKAAGQAQDKQIARETIF